MFLKGGLLMYPLAACSLIALAVILGKGRPFRPRPPGEGPGRGRAAGRRGGRFEQARGAVRSRPPPPGAPARRGAGRTGALPRADLENHLSRLGSRELKRLSHRLHWLELVGRVAPMLGLTGTVTGLTRAFRTVAALKQVTDPGLLASGIWEALITTIAGLFIGIPALIAYHLYDNRLRSLAFEMKTSSEELVAALTERR